MIQTLFRDLRRRSRWQRYAVISRVMRIEEAKGFILDLGGGPASFFSALFPHLERIILMDVEYREAHRAKQMMPALRVVVANGERLPLADRSVAATICNSVIEHVDDPDALASEIVRTSRSFFLQTPNGCFPLETHSLIAIPFYNLIPSARLRRWTCRLFRANYAYVSSVRYLPERQVRALFPDAVFAYERVLGLKKSFYVYRHHRIAR